MFVALKPLLAQTPITLHIAPEGDNFVVTAVPVVQSESNPGLMKPLSLVATPEELDEGFLGAVASFAVVRKSLADQVQAQNADLEAAKKKVAAKKPGATKAGASASTSDDDESEESTSAADTSAQAPAALSASSLFDAD